MKDGNLCPNQVPVIKVPVPARRQLSVTKGTHMYNKYCGWLESMVGDLRVWLNQSSQVVQIF